MAGAKEDGSNAQYRTTSNELRAFVERIERLESDAKEIAEDKKEVMAEAKARGYDTKVLRKVIAERKRDQDDLAEENAVLEMYREALGMGLSNYVGSNDTDEDDDADETPSMV